MKNPYFASRPEEIKNPQAMTAAQILEQTGGNTGNLLFFSALRRVIKHEIPSSGLSFDPSYVKNHHDEIVIPAANWLTARRDMGNLGALIEKADLPTVIVGLGAQSFTKEIPDLLPSTKRFLKAVADRSHSLSVRGTFTAEVVERAGIKNVTVTGCPSLLWKISEPVSVQKSQGEINKISVNATRHDTFDSVSKRKPSIGMKIVRFAAKNRHDIVAQTEEDLIAISRREISGDAFENILPKQSEILELDSTQVQDYLSNHVKTFTSVHQWVRYHRQNQLSFGMRLHGIISCLIAGVPALLITHDTRTEEMAVEAGIPHVKSDSYKDRDFNLEEIYQSIDVENFNIRQHMYYKRFQDFFAQNQVENKLQS